MLRIFENDRAVAHLNQSLADTLKVALHEIENVKKQDIDNEDIYKRLNRAQENIDSVISSFKKINQMITINSFPQNRWKKIELSKPCLISVEKYKDRAKSKNIRLEFKNNTHRAVSFGDELLLEEFIFDNLLSNAIKFAPHDSEIKINLSHNKEYNIFEITDNGIGIEQEQIDSLHSMSGRIYTPDTEGSIGSGMSFPIITQIMSKLNGHLEIDSSRTTTESRARGTTIKLFFNRF